MTNAFYLDELSIDQTAARVFMVDDAAIRAFADVSTDHNPVHVDEAFASASPFKGRIAHGMLLGAYISATLASDLPGRGAIYVSQTLDFKRAVRPGDEATVELTIKAIDLKSGHVTLSTLVKVRNKTMLSGTAVVIAPKRPA
ncbi:MaoC family dehydratase [Asticcacaulis benevestitus]|uniref:MaoC family dehydratase n=1 Tax=Asticcacaulis benevestitus DSM 16100 = ATCC BAA-896 TaxID=1121022 RepID=V4PGS0_9CAUL|nr:MaoC family dehydratase [Asticcacaulis benevestitus]ESQ86414.1 MaoC family dehydratase [Asticcacaulis benevestitus DSM 16100 = ATCC BAA-896]